MKKLMFFLFACFFIGIYAFSQDSTDTIGGGSSGSGFHLSATIVWVLGIILAIYEILVRKIPTLKNYSILGFIIGFIQKIIPNNSVTAKKLP